MKLKRIITLILLFIFILTGNSYAETKNIGNDEIKRLMSLGIPLIDVRRKDEWVSTGVIENSYHHTFFEKDGTYNFKGFMSIEYEGAFSGYLDNHDGILATKRLIEKYL